MLKTNKQLNAILFIISALLFSYTLIRAYLLSITWDEAYTYIEFARNGKVILDKYEMMSANNHILNTWLMMIFTKCFGVSELVMRIPPMIAHILFLIYSAKLLKNIGNKWLVITAFIVVNVNPYMLDFFVVARGYGLSISMMMVSIYYFYLLHTRNKKQDAFLSVLYASLAVLANFVLLNYCVVLFGLMFLWKIYQAKKENKNGANAILFVFKEMALPTLLMVLLFIFVVPITFKLREAGALFFGGERSFWADTISTITDRCFYELGYNYWLQRIAKGFLFLVLIGSSVYVGYTHLKKQITTNALFLGSLILLIGLCSLSTIVQHYLMKTPYLLDRTALFLVVLFNLVFVFFVTEIVNKKTRAQWLVHISALLVVVHFLMTFNLSYVLEWKLDANVKEMLVDLEKTKTIPEGKETVSIGIPLIFDPAINFYREKDNLTWLNTAWRNETTNWCHDYFFLTQEEAVAKKDSIETIKTYPGTLNVLAKPRYPAKERKVLLEQKITFEDKPEKRFVFDEKAEYGPTFSHIITDSLTPDKKGVFIFYANVMAPNPANQNLIMVISFQNSKGELYSWQKAYIKDFIKTEKEWYRASFTCIVPSESHATDEIKAYIWNPEKQNLFVKQMDFEWLGYKF